MVFGITTFGASVLGVLILLYALAVLRDRTDTWALATFVGSAAAFLLPSHIAVALLTIVGAGGVVGRDPDEILGWLLGAPFLELAANPAFLSILVVYHKRELIGFDWAYVARDYK